MTLLDRSAEYRQGEKIARLSRSHCARGLAAGSSGNIGVRLDDGLLLTPANASLGELDPARISKLYWEGALLAGRSALQAISSATQFPNQLPDCGAD